MIVDMGGTDFEGVTKTTLDMKGLYLQLNENPGFVKTESSIEETSNMKLSCADEKTKANTCLQDDEEVLAGCSTVDPVVANCYVFKSMLQEYAQKVGIATPVYDTYMEGPSHVPVFRSSVIVNNVKYDSLPGFFNRKIAEQSAAEVALLELSKSGQMTECIPTVHETGLCKNLLQEYAQKMNYAIPLYKCIKHPSGTSSFISTVEIHGIQYIGAAAKTKKEAEIKAARTALLAIQTASMACSHGSIYTVLPGKKKVKETEQRKAHTEKPLKTKKKTKFKKKWPKRRTSRRKKDESFAKSSTGETGEVNVRDCDASFTANDQTVSYLEMLDKEMKLQLQGHNVQ